MYIVLSRVISVIMCTVLVFTTDTFNVMGGIL
jgi:hypothetical protein